jgi:hypothetical protein
MNKLDVTIDISEDGLETLSEAILQDLDEKVEEILEEKIQDAIDEADLDSKMQTWFDYNIDIEDTVRDVVRETDWSEYIEEIDVEDKLQQLMRSYSPVTHCTTGNLATETVKKAMRYLLLKDEDFVSDIINAINKANNKKMIEDAKSEVIAELTPKLREQFQMELTQYADAIEAEKAREILRNQELISNQQTTTIPLDLV